MSDKLTNADMIELALLAGRAAKLLLGVPDTKNRWIMGIGIKTAKAKITEMEAIIGDGNGGTNE